MANASSKTSTAEASKEADATLKTAEAELPKTQEELIDKRVSRLEKAHASIKSYTIGAMVVGFVPVPLLDLAVFSALQLKLLHSIAKHYEVPFSKNVVKSLVGALVGGSVSVTLAMPISSLLKVVPVIGQTSASISTALTGTALTYALGKIFVEHFETGGTFLNFDVEKAREHFEELYEEGKNFASSHEKEAKAAAA